MRISLWAVCSTGKERPDCSLLQLDQIFRLSGFSLKCKAKRQIQNQKSSEINHSRESRKSVSTTISFQEINNLKNIHCLFDSRCSKMISFHLDFAIFHLPTDLFRVHSKSSFSAQTKTRKQFKLRKFCIISFTVADLESKFWIALKFKNLTDRKSEFRMLLSCLKPVLERRCAKKRENGKCSTQQV